MQDKSLHVALTPPFQPGRRGCSGILGSDAALQPDHGTSGCGTTSWHRAGGGQRCRLLRLAETPVARLHEPVGRCRSKGLAATFLKSVRHDLGIYVSALVLRSCDPHRQTGPLVDP